MKKYFIVLIVIVMAAFVGYYAFPEKVAEFLIGSARSKAGLSKKVIKVGNHDIVYLEGGQGAETILLLHGYSANKDNWVVFSTFLTNYHVVIPDIPGFGESSKLVEAKYDIASQTVRLHEFNQAIKLNKFNIAGNSMGGLLAGAYAVRYPEEVLSVGLFSAAGVKSPRLSEVMSIRPGDENPLLLKDEKDFSRLMKLIFVNPPVLPYPLKKIYLHQALANKGFNQKIITEIVPDIFSLEKDLPKIKAPVLILWGAQDRVIDVSSVAVFEKGLERHQTIILDNCGHVPMLEKPRETADSYIAFIKGIRK